MNEATRPDHQAIIELLPDFALGRLDEASTRRVSTHVAACPRCRTGVDHALEVVGALAVAPPPPAWVRGAILRQAEAARVVKSPVALALPAAPTARPPLPESPPFGRPLPRWALAVASAAVLTIGSLAVWSTEPHHGPSRAAAADSVATLVENPDAIHPLDDSQLPIPARGIVYTVPQDRSAYLVATGLPQLPADKRYQIWLFKEVNSRSEEAVSAGFLNVGPDGEAKAVLQMPAPISDYYAVSLTVEPEQGSSAPTSPQALGGWIGS